MGRWPSNCNLHLSLTHLQEISPAETFRALSCPHLHLQPGHREIQQPRHHISALQNIKQHSHSAANRSQESTRAPQWLAYPVVHTFRVYRHDGHRVHKPKPSSKRFTHRVHQEGRAKSIAEIPDLELSISTMCYRIA